MSFAEPSAFQQFLFPAREAFQRWIYFAEVAMRP
jgi:hypothetical protein